MVPDRMQTQRFEMKYLVTEDIALRVRDYVRSYLDLDEYGAAEPNLSYAVHSLYLDSDTMTTYWNTINGDRNRFKLRLRYYSTDPDSAVFFEIKRRVNSCILKQRGGVKQEAVPVLLGGFLPEPSHLVRYTEKALVALQNFCGLVQQIHAKPKIHVAYMREAYANEPGTVRVTMDRQVHACANLDHQLRLEMDDPHYSFQPFVILELKFTDRFPNWFGEMVRHFGVMQRGAAKYCASAQAIGHVKLKAIFPMIPEEEVSALDSGGGD